VGPTSGERVQRDEAARQHRNAAKATRQGKAGLAR
jgi:hypothetical protein